MLTNASTRDADRCPVDNSPERLKDERNLALTHWRIAEVLNAKGEALNCASRRRRSGSASKTNGI
jgi:hypothetical protein